MLKYFKKSIGIVLVALLLSNFVCIFNAKEPSSARYSGYGNAVPYSTVVSQETINFTRREVEQVETVNGVPTYIVTQGLTNACGAVAGTIIVGFYDKYYEDLIPDYSTYILTGRYRSSDSVYVPKAMREMYTLMRTNVDDVGVSQSDCLNGLKAYVENKGHTLEYLNIKSNSRVNETLLKSTLNENKPAILFCSKIDIYSLSFTDTYDTITCTNLTSAGHIVVACGLYTIKYYNGNNLFRTDKYIKVATGLSNSTSYLKLESDDWCDAAYSVAIN